MGRAGRKRQVGVREPNGRLRRIAERDDSKAGVAVRARLHGLALKDARDPRAENALGRWYLRQLISQEQHEAGVAFLADYDSYKRAIAAPDALRRSEPGRRPSVEITDDYVAWCERKVEGWEAVTAELRRCNGYPSYRHLTLYAALNSLVLRNVEVVHLLEDVRAALDVLAIYYRTARRN